MIAFNREVKYNDKVCVNSVDSGVYIANDKMLAALLTLAKGLCPTALANV
jgi:hypothetical protein